jgi:ABC-type Fe3+/spermidine/putrescine transport system ATPase subunit
VAETPAHLRLEGVTKRFGEALAVDRVSLEIPRGTFATLLGPSGCGKTTTLRMIAGFVDPDEGSIYLSGRRLNELPAHRRGTAMVFQDYALFPHMTVRNNVAYGLKLARVSRADRERRVGETLEFVGLGRLGDRYPGQLSGGQQQRVALARALVIEPEVLLLDEPLSNLDARLREQLRWELRAMQKRLDMTFVYVTHDQEEALSMSDWIAVMNEGRVEQAGPPAEVYYRPRTVFAAGFVGTVNLVPARVVRAEEDCLTVSLDGRDLAIPGARADGVGVEVQLCIRPETLGIGPTQSGPFNLRGTISRSAFLGDLRRYWVEVGESEWIVDVTDPGAEVMEGPVEISVRPERVHVISVV